MKLTAKNIKVWKSMTDARKAELVEVFEIARRDYGATNPEEIVRTIPVCYRRDAEAYFVCSA